MIKEILNFYKMADKMEKDNLTNQTLGEFLKSKNMSSYFVKFHIIPMVSAIWSMPTDLAYEMPLSLFLSMAKYAYHMNKNDINFLFCYLH